MKNLKVLNDVELRSSNGGATYHCPWCYNCNGGYWKVYWHALSKGCYRKDPFIKGCADAAWWCVEQLLLKRLGL